MQRSFLLYAVGLLFRCAVAGSRSAAALCPAAVRCFSAQAAGAHHRCFELCGITVVFTAGIVVFAGREKAGEDKAGGEGDMFVFHDLKFKYAFIRQRDMFQVSGAHADEYATDAGPWFYRGR